MGSVITARGLAVNPSSGGERNCIVYSLFCKFIISSAIRIISSVSISFVVLLNCLYLNPRVSLLCISPPHPSVGG